MATALEERLGSGTPDRGLRFEEALRDFYREREYAPFWISMAGRESRLESLLIALRRSEEDGLYGAVYGMERISRLLAVLELLPLIRRIDLELLLSDAYLAFASDLAFGRVDPRTLPGEWSNEREPFDAADALSLAVAKGVTSALDHLRPAHPQYRGLRRVLASLRTIPDWGTVPEGDPLGPGDVDSRVATLRSRLSRDGFAGGGQWDDSPVFDVELEGMVKEFQRRHGLDVDGIVGSETLDALNVPVAVRVRQIEANLERWRWLPRDLGSRFVMVNVPDFSVTLVGPDGTTARRRAVVGRTDRQTPTFSSTIESFSLAPYWNVPPTPALSDILPQIREDLAYLDRQDMKVLERSSDTLVDPGSIDWSSIGDTIFLERYRLRQEPGPKNALGDVRLVFPTRYTVYLHDTPSRSLFGQTPRALSSGCIRVERPLELLNWLLSGDPEWPEKRITEVIDGGEEVHGRIREPVPIHVVYLTAAVEEDGRPIFLSDIYGMDGALDRALEMANGASGPTLRLGLGTCS
jgi:murein L,D-transpeptidase YcbB/YkuD